MCPIRLLTLVLAASSTVASCSAGPLLTPDPDTHTRRAAERMARASRGVLAPVYAPLAEYVVSTYRLADTVGIGIDLGGGPGVLSLELCKRTDRMYWINADINPHFFPIFSERVAEADLGHRVGAVFADAQALPFRDGYADVIVSRASFHFWKDRERAFREIYRVLKPGGVAFIGRGFSKNLPVEIARKVRAQQGTGAPSYVVAETRAELKRIMTSLGITMYRIETPQPAGSEGIKYGIWLEIRKQEPTAGKS